MEIIELLSAKNIPFIVKATDEIAIQCPNAANHHGGYDHIPSFNINTERLVAHCFACDFSLKQEELVRWLIGGELEEFDIKAMAVRAKIKQMEHAATKTYKEAYDVMLPPGEPWGTDGFRGVSLDTYRKLGAIKCDRGFYDNRLVFPIYLEGELIGVDARALKEGMQPKYLRNKGSSCATNWLYPYDVVKAMKPNYVILGEGMFHAVNAVDKGFPALCFFGANNFSKTKMRMLLALNIDYVIYFRDEDKAGIKAEQQICSMLESWLPIYSADNSKTPEGSDLGDLSTEEIQWALDNKKKPEVPLCLPEGKAPKFDTFCTLRKCPFNNKGKCRNAYW